MEKSMSEACTASWRERVIPKLKNAVVFADTKIAEIVHWMGGLGAMFDAGAVDVREFSSFESGGEDQKKGVFLVSSPLEAVTEQVLHDIITQSHFLYVVVMTTAHPLLHTSLSAASIENGSPFDDLEESLQEWMGNMNYTAEVRYFSMFSCELSPGFFITPAFSELFPLMSSDLQQINYQRGVKSAKDASACDSVNDLEMSHLPDALQMQIRLFSTSLDGLLQSMNVKEDIYSVGSLSRIVATDLDSFPPAKARRKACQSRLSLILMDRSLDLASAVTRQVEVLLDKMVNTLPSLGGHSTDRLVDMSHLCHCYSTKSGQGIVLPGCLSRSKWKETPPFHLTPTIMKKHKEALMDINRKLVETATLEKLPLDLSRRPSRVTADVLDSTLALFKGKYPIIEKHLDTLQVATATSQTLRHPSTQHHDGVIAAKEKNIIQTIADTEGGGANDDDDDDDDSVYPSALSLVSKLLLAEMGKSREDRELSLDDILHLLVYVYSLSDGSSEKEEEVSQLQDQLVRAIIKDKNFLPPLTQTIVGDKVTESIVPDQIESMWDKLDSLVEARRDLKDFGHLVDVPGDGLSPATVMPLVRQMMEKILDPSRPDLVDVECKSGGLKDLLKSGFGFFKSAAKPRPGDAPVLMVMVIGGVTAFEVKQIHDMVASAKPGFEVIVGGTRINNVDSMMRSILVDDNINLGHHGGTR